MPHLVVDGVAAVLAYEEYISSLQHHHDPKLPSGDVNLLRENVKQHLLSVGWKFWMIDKKTKRGTREELRYTSPTGKTYISLTMACKGYLQSSSPAEAPRRRTVRKSGKSILHNNPCRDIAVPDHHNQSQKPCKSLTQKNHCVEIAVYDDDRKKSRKPCKNTLQNNPCRDITVVVDDRKQSRKRKAGAAPPRRASKKSREDTMQYVPSTVLNWLIGKEVVSLGEEVGIARKRGLITTTGIRCECCNRVFSILGFADHAGSGGGTGRAAADIVLRDGRSLLQCQIQMMPNDKCVDYPHSRFKSDLSGYASDSICSLCNDGGLLIICEHCPSTFHPECVGLEEAPRGDWFCPCCLCAACGSSEFDPCTELTEKVVMRCDQCERKYHVGCLQERVLPPTSCPTTDWFCSTKCSKIFHHLRELLGKHNSTSVNGLHWTLLRWSGESSVDIETRSENHSKLLIALDILHECFEEVTDSYTQSDLVADLIFNKERELNRLNFWGFYTMLLEKGDEIISVATFRVYGDKVAEMPLIGTRSHYRRQGMCHLLVGELEMLLFELGIEKLLLPAVPQLLEIWTTSFKFTEMMRSDLLKFSQYTILNFQGTTMCQKVLRPSTTVLEEPRGTTETIMLQR